MKNLSSFFLVLALLSIVSCSIDKRLYRPGFNIEHWTAAHKFANITPVSEKITVVNDTLVSVLVTKESSASSSADGVRISEKKEELSFISKRKSVSVPFRSPSNKGKVKIKRNATDRDGEEVLLKLMFYLLLIIAVLIAYGLILIFPGLNTIVALVIGGVIVVGIIILLVNAFD